MKLSTYTGAVLSSSPGQRYVLDLDPNEFQAVRYYMWRANLARDAAAYGDGLPYSSLLAAGARVSKRLHEAIPSPAGVGGRDSLTSASNERPAGYTPQAGGRS